MSDFQKKTFSNEDVKSVVKLLGTTAAMTDDIPVRRRWLCEGLAKLIDGDIWHWLLIKDDPSLPDPIAYAFIDGGWAPHEEKQRELFRHGALTEDVQFVNDKVRGKRYHATTTRSEIASTQEWESSNLVTRYFRPAGVSEIIFSIYPLEEHIISSISFQRRLGKPPFGPREKALTHLVIGQIEWLHRADLRFDIAAAVPSLTLRQREILYMLLEGHARKRIAHKLRISPYTVADHIQSIYHHFSVTSQSELVSHFYRGGSANT